MSADEKKNLIGANVRRIRESKNLTQLALVDLMHEKGYRMSTAGISKLETQIRKATDIEVIALSKTLEVDIDELFAPVDPESADVNE